MKKFKNSTCPPQEYNFKANNDDIELLEVEHNSNKTDFFLTSDLLLKLWNISSCVGV